jgi:hypothetical protein
MTEPAQPIKLDSEPPKSYVVYRMLYIVCKKMKNQPFNL